MYIAPTPYGLVSGADRQITLILPENYPLDPRLEVVGNLNRVAADRLVIGYSFNMTTNEITPEYTNNPSADNIHSFVAYRAKGVGGPEVCMRSQQNRQVLNEF